MPLFLVSGPQSLLDFLTWSDSTFHCSGATWVLCLFILHIPSFDHFLFPLSSRPGTEFSLDSYCFSTPRPDAPQCLWSKWLNYGKEKKRNGWKQKAWPSSPTPCLGECENSMAGEEACGGLGGPREIREWNEMKEFGSTKAVNLNWILEDLGILWKRRKGQLPGWWNTTLGLRETVSRVWSLTYTGEGNIVV